MRENLKKLTQRFWPEMLIFLGLAILLLWGLDSAGMIADESTYAVRAWRWVDFLFSAYQTTPWQWFNPLPSWAFLSFHDAPPLAFWWQHIFFRLVGISTFAARLPGALAGLLAAVALYATMRTVFNRRTALVGSSMLLVLTPFFWIHRSAYLEPTMVAWLLLAFYSFFKARRQLWWYAAVGFFFGLALLTKYTALFIAPALVAVVIWQRPRALRSLKLWSGVALALIMQYPVVVYNLLMFRTRGHADVQIAALLGQSNRDWPLLTTRVNIDFWSSFIALGQNIVDLYSWPVIAAVGLAAVIAVRQLVLRDRTEYGLFAMFLLISWIVFMVLTRKDPRFIATGYFFVPLILAPLTANLRLKSWPLMTAAIVLAAYSFFYSLQTNYLPQRWGRTGLTYSSFAARGYGLLAVEKYLDALLANKDPQILMGDEHYRRFDPIRAQEKIFDFDKASLLSKRKYLPDIILYDQRINWFAEIWYFKRIFYFQRFLVISTRDLYQLHDNSPEAYAAVAAGKKFHYFEIMDDDLIDKIAGQESINPVLEKILTASSTAQLLTNQGVAAFKLYTGTLP